MANTNNGGRSVMTANGHRYEVEFRIFSETLDPTVITRELGLDPCQVRIHGSRRSDGKTFIGMWAFDGSKDDTTQRSVWTSLEEGLSYVLDDLWPRRNIIAGYASNAELIWWCGHFQNSFDGGPRLSPHLLKRLGEFGAVLYIDNYFSEPDEPKANNQHAGM